MKLNNPFIISGYVLPEYFCDREEETKKVINALKNGRNITLFSIRRLGKTGLIEHVFNELKSDKNFICFYLDILPTSNLNDFINVFASSLFGKLESGSSKFLKKLQEMFLSLRPVISYDQLTGNPNIQFNLQSAEETNKSLEKIFAYLNQNEKKIVIAIDEFQQITNYPEKNVEAVLRANIQHSTKINFIFSGSQKHILLSIFSDYGKPFYQGAELMHLERINKQSYSDFIKKKFASGKKKISGEAIELILNICRSHTFYVQYLCNRIFSLRDNVVDVSIVKETMQSILMENEVVYINYRNLLTGYQWSVLKAIAKEGNAKLLTSKDFIKKHNLGTPSSVHTAVNALLNKEMIYREADDYLVYDVFLERWLEKL
ncbi:MAG: ATP-binding protein [Ignavibacteriales bacterium]|nr:ATP-binding protein [Ignavibacteriales bacterium]